VGYRPYVIDIAKGTDFACSSGNNNNNNNNNLQLGCHPVAVVILYVYKT
jgi:hypothetical protein